jgi:flagellar motor switch protein FliN/FliY
MSEVLSKDEIDSLLNAINGEDEEFNKKIDVFKKDNGKVSFYDFERPRVFTGKECRLIEQIVNQKILPSIPSNSSIRLVSLDEMTNEEFFRSIDPNKSTIIENNNLIISFDFPFKMVGDESFLNITRKIYSTFISEYMEPWHQAKYDEIDKSPLNQIGFLFTFDCRDENNGMINLFFRKKENYQICPLYWMKQSLRTSVVNNIELPERSKIMNSMPVKCSVVLGSATLKVSDVMQLGAGSIIELDNNIGSMVDFVANGQVIAKGEVITIDDKFGIRITDIEENEEKNEENNAEV